MKQYYKKLNTGGAAWSLKKELALKPQWKFLNETEYDSL